MTQIRENTSLPRPSQMIQEELEEFRASCRPAREYGARDLASGLALQSIEMREQELLEELSAAEMLESDGDAEFCIVGEPLRAHLIPISLLGKFLENLQKLMNSIASFQDGIASIRGVIRENIARVNKLMMTPEFIPGSFGFRVRLLNKEESGETEESASKENLRILAKMFDSSILANEIAEIVASPRVESDYTEILNLLARENAGLRIRHREAPFAKVFLPSSARERLHWLEILETKEEEIYQEGLITGGSIETGKFELKCEEGIIRGNLTEPTKKAIKYFHWNDPVRMHLRIKTTTNEDGSVEKSRYTALSIESSSQTDMFQTSDNTQAQQPA